MALRPWILFLIFDTSCLLASAIPQQGSHPEVARLCAKYLKGEVDVKSVGQTLPAISRFRDHLLLRNSALEIYFRGIQGAPANRGQVSLRIGRLLSTLNRDEDLRYRIKYFSTLRGRPQVLEFFHGLRLAKEVYPNMGRRRLLQILAAISGGTLGWHFSDTVLSLWGNHPQKRLATRLKQCKVSFTNQQFAELVEALNRSANLDNLPQPWDEIFRWNPQASEEARTYVWMQSKLSALNRFISPTMGLIAATLGVTWIPTPEKKFLYRNHLSNLPEIQRFYEQIQSSAVNRYHYLGLSSGHQRVDFIFFKESSDDSWELSIVGWNDPYPFPF